MPEPTAYDQFLLELINKARANPTAEASRLGINLNQGLNAGQISTAPKQPLAFDGDLVDAAHKHSKWMLDTDTFSHTGAGGSSFTARMKAEGYVFSGSWTAGENISWGGTTGTVNQLTHTQARHDGLFKSPGHRLNILNDNFKEIGTGVEFGKYGVYNASMVTEDFAKSGTASFITGVAYDDRNDNNFYTPGEGRGGIKVSAVSTSTTNPVTVTDLTGAAGGYDIAVAPGTYKVTFSEGGLAAPVTRTVTVGSKNVKIDLIDPPDGRRPGRRGFGFGFGYPGLQGAGRNCRQPAGRASRGDGASRLGPRPRRSTGSGRLRPCHDGADRRSGRTSSGRPWRPDTELVLLQSEFAFSGNAHYHTHSRCRRHRCASDRVRFTILPHPSRGST